jgi:multidrug efflux pump subunit AcrA (membrane-fusion protein)
MATRVCCRWFETLYDLFRGKIRGMVPSMRPVPYLCLVVSCAFLYGCASKGSTPPGGKKGGGGDVPVSVTKVTRKNVPVEVQVIGNVEAYSTIAVKAQVGGILTKVDFKEGDYVKSGDLLFTIDPRPLKAQLDQAVATLAKDQALLRQAEANLARDLAQEKYAVARRPDRESQRQARQRGDRQYHGHDDD